MKILVLGFAQMSGISKANSAYNICQVFAGEKVSPVTLEKMKKIGVGFEPVTIPMDESCIPAFASLESKFPAVFELVTDMRLRGGKMEPIVVGIKPAAA